MELDVLALCHGGMESPWGSLNWYANVTFLDAEFTNGLPSVVGKQPVFAPDYNFKTGAIYRWKDVVKVGLIGTMLIIMRTQITVISALFRRIRFGTSRRK